MGAIGMLVASDTISRRQSCRTVTYPTGRRSFSSEMVSQVSAPAKNRHSHSSR